MLIKKAKIKNKYAAYPYIFLAPLFIVYAVFSLYPLIYSGILSFTNLQGLNPDYDFIGLSNYAYLLKQPRFYQALSNTLTMWLVSFVLQFGVALFFAFVFSNARIKIRGKGFFKVVYYMPQIMTTASIAALFYMLWSAPYGAFFKVFEKFIPDFIPLERPVAAQMLYSSISFWQWFGPIMITLSAGMLGVSPSLYEAAEIDGAGRMKTFLKITIPSIRPILLYVLITSLLGGLQSFELSYLFNPIGGQESVAGGPLISGDRYATETIAVYIYSLAFGPGRYQGTASALSILLLIVAVILSTVVFKLTAEKEKPSGAKKQGRVK